MPRRSRSRLRRRRRREHHPQAPAGSEGDVSRTQTGIIYIDEIDKIGRKDENHRSPRRLGEGVQQALLKILEARLPTSAARRTQASASGIYARRYHEHPVHLRRRFCRPGKDHRAALGQEGSRLPHGAEEETEQTVASSKRNFEMVSEAQPEI